MEKLKSYFIVVIILALIFKIVKSELNDDDAELDWE